MTLQTLRRGPNALRTVAILLSVAGFASISEAGFGRCLWARLDATVVLPDDSTHEARNIRICVRRFSPFENLLRVSVNHEVIGEFRRRAVLTEGQPRRGERGFFLFRKRNDGALKLQAFGERRKEGMWLYRMLGPNDSIVADAGFGSPDGPLRSDLEERARRRLVQIDVTVTGPREVISTLERDDFELYLGNLAIGGRAVDAFTVDRLCPSAPLDAALADPPVSSASSSRPAAAAPTSYVFYFDQAHLTFRGRHHAMTVARDLIEDLVSDAGARAMIVSHGPTFETFADWSSDVWELLAALQRLEDDPRQFDAFAQAERGRVDQVLMARSFGYKFGENAMQRLQREEISKAEISWRTMAHFFDRLADVPPPKVLFYFSDTMRSRPGQFYLGLLGARLAALEIGDVDPYAAAQIFDETVGEATATGVRVYAIQSSDLATSNPNSGVDRERDNSAVNSLAGFSRQTGGKHFLSATRVKTIVREVRDDLSCRYLISFDPEGFHEDTRLGVHVEVDRPFVKVQAPKQIVIRSDSARLRSRLLAAYDAPDSEGSGLAGSVIPTGYRDGDYLALVQVHAPDSDFDGSTWDIGLSSRVGKSLRAGPTTRVMLDTSLPLVFEAEMSFAPGDTELTMIAHETFADEIASDAVRVVWPDPDASPFSVGPIALLQPDSRLFVRGDETKTEGSVALAATDLVRAGRPLVFVSLVCRKRSRRGPTLEVERYLSGETTVDFPPLEPTFDGTRCVQVRDLVRAGTMTGGGFSYEIRILREGEVVARGERAFVVAD